jgi:hypothetical protein
MADLEKLAIKRDRGYLVRLILMLAVGLLAGVFIFSFLTSARVTGCMASTLMGSETAGEEAKQDPAP